MEFSPRPGPTLLIGLALAAWASSCPALADDQGAAKSPSSPEERAYHDQIVPLLNRYCVKCHGPDEVKGNVDLARYGDVEAVRRDRKTWEKVVENVEAGIMPPEGDMPGEEEVARLVGWVQAALSKDGCDIENPGRVTLRRLNRAEYNNTVRDLLGVDFRPADNFPVDDVGYGFDNIGDVLTVQPLLMEKYLDAAEAVAAKAIVVPEPNPGATRSRAGKDLEGGDPYGDGGRILASTGETGAGFELSEAGDYRVRVRAFGQQAGDEPVKISVRLDGREIGTFDVRGEEGDAETFEVATRLEPGDRRVTVAFLNDFYDPENADASRRDRNLVVESLEVVGPSGPPLWPIAERDARRLDGGNRERGRRTLGSSGEITARVEFPADGRYHLVVRASGDQAGPEPVKMGVRVDGKDVATVDVTAAEGEPGRYEVAAEVAKGEHQVALAFLNDYYKPEAEDPKDRGDRNLHVAGLEILGPAPGSLPEFHRSILDRTPGDGGDWRGAAREILRPFMNRAYRRPARDDEVERMVTLAELPRKDGEPFERGIQLAVTAVLVDPHFLYRVEVDRRGIPEGTSPGAIRPLDDWELASRLSYFLWSSMPDEELFRLAGEGKLQDDAVLEAQARRMLADPKSKALVENFATQWLTLRAVWNINPDPRRFKGFDNKLREAMIRETELFFESVMREDRGILDLLDADYTFLNESLAKHYGVEGVSGDEFRRVDLPPDSPRGGVLTQASILTITSNPTRTSPVKRGKWILEQILGTPPPPPPPDVPELKEGRQATGTLRQRMEQHRSNPSCASCHAKMDPLGFGFENFDAVGRWRDEERGDKIDPSGVLPTGESFAGVEELKGMLVRERAGQFTRNLAEKMLTFALGRGLEYYDACAVDTIAERAAADGHKFSRLVVEIVKSDPFRKRLREEGVER
jgi:mono/diheme cytochrome c family protein